MLVVPMKGSAGLLIPPDYYPLSNSDPTALCHHSAAVNLARWHFSLSSQYPGELAQDSMWLEAGTGRNQK